MQMTEKEQDILNRLGKYIHTNSVSIDFLVQLFELSGDYANMMTIPKYAKQNNLTYNGVKKTRNIKEMRGVKWVIEEETN